MTPSTSTRFFPSTPNTRGKGTIGNCGKETQLEMIVEDPILKEMNEDVEKERTKTSQLWVDIIQGNRLPSNGCELTYTTPMEIDGEIEVQLEEKMLPQRRPFGETHLSCMP